MTPKLEQIGEEAREEFREGSQKLHNSEFLGLQNQILTNEFSDEFFIIFCFKIE